MHRLKFLILFFGLPTSLLRGITVASHHLYYRYALQLQVYRRSFHTRYFITLLFIVSITQKTNAQTDSNYVDSTSMRNIDSVAASTSTNNEPGGYDDQDDGYVDTTVKHIYDTSQYFFNWKDSYDDPYSKEKITQRHLIDAEVNTLKNEDDFWYIHTIEKLETRLKNDPKFRDSLLHAKNRELMDEHQKGLLFQSWFNTLLWIIIIGIFAAAVIYFLLQNKINIFSKESAASAENESNEEQEDIFQLSYSKLIQNAEKATNYRVGVRLMFLQTLKLLSDTNHIQYQPDYTDLHYLQQLQPSKYYNEFFNVMRSYEYIWYGKFEVSGERYKAIKNDFIKLQHKIT